MTAEDFMDEEDLAEVAESQQVVTKSQFDGLGGTAEELGSSSQKNAGDLFDDLVKPKEDTIGISILRKMGWREGQGVGPRVQRKIEGDEDGEMYSLAPVNIAVVALERKTNSNGLGYTLLPGLERRIEKPVTKKSVTGTKAMGGMRGSMGVGVLNEDDDEDPYDVGLSRDMYSKTVVPKREKVEKHAFKPAAKHTFTVTSKAKTTTTESIASRRGHDGRLPLPGFTLSETPFTLTSQWYTLSSFSSLTIGSNPLQSPKTTSHNLPSSEQAP